MKQHLIIGTTFLWRTIWRLLVLVLVVGLAYVSTFILLPFLDRRLPIFPALLILYLLLAYIGIPLIIQIWRIVFKPDHIPRYVTTPDGWPADPVNIAIVANSKKHLIDAMTGAGWYMADKSTIKNLIREAISILFRTPYPNAPFSKLYLFGRPFDIGFQMPRHTNKSAHARHHVRFWRLRLPDDRNHHKHYHFWHKQLKHLLGIDKEIWIGAAIDDTGPLAFRWRNFQITHQNDPNTDTERDLIISSLKLAKKTKRVTSIQAGEPFRFRGQTLANNFICDGSIKVVELKNPVMIKLTPGKRTIKH